VGVSELMDVKPPVRENQSNFVHPVVLQASISKKEESNHVSVASNPARARIE